MYDKILNEILPNALMIGVDYELFWTLNPKSLSPFVKAFSLKQEYDDLMAWKHGSYIRMAIASCLSKEVKYPTKPIMMKETYDNAEKIKEKMFRQMELINSRFRKEGI